jgi:hypothetical protein
MVTEEQLHDSVMSVISSLDLLGDDEKAEAELAALLRETSNKSSQRDILLRTLRCCSRLAAAEPFLKIEEEARDYADGVRARAETAARREAQQTRWNAEYAVQRTQEELQSRQRALADAEADCERRMQELVAPHAAAIALLKTILAQYPVQRGERLPPTAFLSACALVASLLGTNPVDLALNLSGGNFEFKSNGRR